jgi:signal transduction histidine kinase
MNGIGSALEQYSGIIELDVEYMYTREKVDEAYYESLYSLYKYKASRKKYDVIITSDNNALSFVLKHRSKLYPSVPVVFCGINDFNESMIEGHELVTGVTEEEILEPTVEIALKLHRSIETTVVLLHGSKKEYGKLETARKVISKRGQSVNLITITLDEVLTKEKMAKRMNEFWGKSIIIFAVPFRNPRGYGYSLEDASSIIRQQHNTPMYALSEEWFDHCPIVGGKVNSGYDQGRAAAEMAMCILDGQKSEDIPIVLSGVDRYIFDYNKLIQFRISPSALPEQSVLINEPQSFYYLYKRRIWTVFAIFLFLVLAILSLSASAVRLKKTRDILMGYQLRLRSLASKLSLTEERERHRIATELHDRISQSLVISKVKLETLRESSSTDSPENFVREINEVCDFLNQTIQSTRSLTFDLSSPMLDEKGFEAAVSDWLNEHIRKKYDIVCRFKDDGRPKLLDEDVRALLFRNVQELLMNVVKHAKANSVEVISRSINGQIQVIIEDDGIGFDTTEFASGKNTVSGFGLFGIRERLEQLGGHFEIESEPGHGTRVELSAPLKHAESDEQST